MKISYYQEITKTGFETDEIIGWLYENLEDGTWEGKITNCGKVSSEYYDRKMIKELGDWLITTTFYFEEEEAYMGFKLRWL